MNLALWADSRAANPQNVPYKPCGWIRGKLTDNYAALNREK